MPLEETKPGRRFWFLGMEDPGELREEGNEEGCGWIITATGKDKWEGGDAPAAILCFPPFPACGRWG